MRPAVLLLAAAVLPAASLKIDSGLADHQVYQRDSGGFATILAHGKTTASGAVEVRIMRGLIPVSGFDWRAAGSAANGEFRIEVTGVPTGGPYRVDLRAAGDADVTSVHNILVGDLWVLAGQSNMQGVGDLVDVEQPNALVHSFDMAHQWGVAEEPLHTLVSAKNPVHWPRTSGQPEKYEGERLRKYIAERRKGAGLGLPFAVEMVKRTGVPVGLLPCAHGGTSMDQWNPELRDKSGEALYGSMMMRIREAGGRVTGVLWYQGESDANPKAAPEFQGKFERLVAALRADTATPDLPFYFVQLGRNVSRASPVEWNAVQEMQRKAESAIARSGMVAAVDTDLDDGIHVGTQDLKRLGRRLANLACHDLFPSVAQCVPLKRGPRPVSATFAAGVVRVVYSEVNGGLLSRGRLMGFSIHGADGAPVPLIYKARIDPGNPSHVLLSIGGKLPEGATLWYGHGRDPYVNLADRADMAAPAFGPMPIAVP
jgi:sialate O-acetylesterase